MAKRDYVKEIKDIRSRYLKSGTRWDQYRRRMVPLADLLLNIDKIEGKDIKREILRYSFICSIACLEGYFRLVIQDLIDNKKSCLENIEKISDLKFDIKSVIAIHGKEVSIGEFVSHLIPMSSFEQLNKNLSIITGLDFTEELKGMEISTTDGKKRKLFKDITKYLKKTYDFRNIYCHELAPKKEALGPLARSAKECFLAMTDYIYASEVFIRYFLGEQPSSSET